MSDTAPQNTGQVGKAAAAAVAPDAVTAELLAKHSAGEKLNPSQYGKLGAWSAKLQRLITGGPEKTSLAPGPAQSGPVPGNPLALAPVATVQAPDGSLAPLPIDPGIVQRTTNTVLTRCESIARRVVTSAAKEAGATGETLARFDRSACLPKDDRALIVDLSPDVFASMGLNPRHYPLAICLGTLGLWGTDIWLAVQELKAMREQKAASSPATNEEKAPAQSKEEKKP